MAAERPLTQTEMALAKAIASAIVRQLRAEEVSPRGLLQDGPPPIVVLEQPDTPEPLHERERTGTDD